MVVQSKQVKTRIDDGHKIRRGSKKQVAAKTIVNAINCFIGENMSFFERKY